MADAPRPLTRQQLAAFLKDHAAIRTMERMSVASLVDMPEALDDVNLVATTADARALEAVAAINRLSDAIEALLNAPVPLPVVVPDDLTPVPVPLTAGALATTLGSVLSANPTATVGPTVTNGTLNTYIRSDGAPAINLTATYPWTGLHSFALAGNMASPTILMSSTAPVVVMDASDQAADEKRWGLRVNAKTFQRRTATDNGSASIIWETITRGTGTAITNMAWGDTANNNTYTFGSTGTATFSGQVTALRFVPTSSSVASNGMYLPAANTVGFSANSTLSAQLTSTTFQALLQFILSGDISPAQLTANTDDWNPTGLSTATIIRASTDASRNLTGIQGGADGRVLILINVGTQPLVLVHDSTSTAANRFFLASSTNTTVQANGACILWYDSTSSRWRQITRIA